MKHLDSRLSVLPTNLAKIAVDILDHHDAWETNYLVNWLGGESFSIFWRSGESEAEFQWSPVDRRPCWSLRYRSQRERLTFERLGSVLRDPKFARFLQRFVGLPLNRPVQPTSDSVSAGPVDSVSTRPVKVPLSAQRAEVSPSKAASPNASRTSLQRVEWLAEFLDLTTWAAHEAIRTGKIPASCIVRLGRSIRVNEDLVRAWAAGTLPDADQTKKPDP